MVRLSAARSALLARSCSGVTAASLSCFLSCFLLGGCGPFHTTSPVAIEVIDGLTGQPAPGVTVIQQVHTGKFERPLRTQSTSDESGELRLRAIGHVRTSFWRVGTDGPAYDGEGAAQIPAEFTSVAPSGDGSRFLAPAWPAITLRIKLPSGYRGPVVEWPLGEDAPRSSGWMPPLSVAPGSSRVAVARATTQGTLAYPCAFNGVPGFEFVPERGFLEGDAPIPSVGATSQLSERARSSMDPEGVFRWEIGYSDGDRWVSPQGRGATAGEPLVWFVGTEQELRAWIATNHLELIWPGVPDKLDAIDRSRSFTRESLFAVIERPTAATEPPRWSTQSELQSEHEARADASIEP